MVDSGGDPNGTSSTDKEDASAPPAAPPEAGHDTIGSAIRGGDLEGVKNALRSLTTEERQVIVLQRRTWTGPHGTTEGPLLIGAIVHDYHHLVSFLFECHQRVSGSARQALLETEATFVALRLGRHSLTFLLVSKGCNPNHQRKKDGGTLLHVACGRKQPPLSFIQQLLKLPAVNVDLCNQAGNTPLHELALKAQGSSTVPVARLLKSRGAWMEKPVSGKTALQLTKNGPLREYLGVCGARVREEPGLDPESEAELDGLTVAQLTQRAIESPREIVQRGNGKRKEKGKKLTTEDQTKLIDRLVDQALSRWEGNLEALKHKYIPQQSRIVLGEDAMEAYADRHHYDEVQRREDDLQDLHECYVQDLVPATELTEEEMDASVQRLYYEGMNHHAEVHRAAQERWVSPLLQQSHQRTPQELGESVAQLYYKAVAGVKEREQVLYDKWLAPQEDAARAQKRLTQQQVAAQAERLSAKTTG